MAQGDKGGKKPRPETPTEDEKVASLVIRFIDRVAERQWGSAGSWTLKKVGPAVVGKQMPPGRLAVVPDGPAKEFGYRLGQILYCSFAQNRDRFWSLLGSKRLNAEEMRGICERVVAGFTSQAEEHELRFLTRIIDYFSGAFELRRSDGKRLRLVYSDPDFGLYFWEEIALQARAHVLSLFDSNIRAGFSTASGWNIPVTT